MKDLTQLLEQLALKLGVTTEYLWIVLLRQAKISAIMDIVFILFVIMLGFALFRVYKYCDKEDLLNEDIWGGAMIISFIIWIIMLIVIPFALSNIITVLANPEYWALDEILDSLK